MLVTELKGNLHTAPLPTDIHVERVTLPSAELVKRIQRVKSDHGTEIGIRLPAGAPDLKDGDILHLDEKNAIVIQVEPTDVLVIGARSIKEMGVVAHSLGNRHLQAQFFDATSEYGADVMVVQYDHTVEQYLQSVEIPFDRQARVMPVAFRHNEHKH